MNFMSSSSNQKEYKYMRVITYIRRNFQKITALSTHYRLKNMNLFHYYMIGDLATDSLNVNDKDFSLKLRKSLKKIEMKNTVSKNQIASAVFSGSLENKQNSKYRKFFLNIHNSFYKFWLPVYNKFSWLKKNIRNTFKVMPPNSPFKISYDIFCFFMAIVSFLFFPLHNIFWSHQDKNFVILLFLVIFFSSEIIIDLNTAYIKNGIIYYDRKKILLHSINIYKMLDIIFLYYSLEALTTNDIIEEGYYEDSEHVINALVSNLLIVYKVIKISEISIYIEDFIFNLNEKASIILRMIKLLAFNFICAHLLACSWISISFFEKKHNQTNNWAFNYDIEKNNWFEIYIYGLYFGVTTMLTVGYGDITPNSPNEVLFTIIAIIFSCCLYGYTMNTVGVILKDYNYQEKTLKYLYKEKYFW